MFALIGILGVVTSLFSGISGGVLAVLESPWQASLGVRFYAGLTVGLIITNNAVRDVRHQARQGGDRGGARK